MKKFIFYALLFVVVFASVSYLSRSYISELKDTGPDEVVVYIMKKNGDVIQGLLLTHYNSIYVVKDNDNRIVKIPDAQVEDVLKEIKQKTFWTKAKGVAKNTAAKAAGMKVAKILTVSHGESVEIRSHLSSGYAVIFYFYADWVASCRTMGPQLESLANEYPDVLLRKIDINNWDSPAAQQYNVRFVPHVLIYDKHGLQAGGPTADFSVVVEAVNNARSK